MKVTFTPGPSKLLTMKIIKETLHIGLRDAKDCVDTGQFECTEEQFESIKATLVEIGNDGFKTVL